MTNYCLFLLHSYNIGICYNFQVNEKLPVEPFDRRMDEVWTENGILKIVYRDTNCSISYSYTLHFFKCGLYEKDKKNPSKSAPDKKYCRKLRGYEETVEDHPVNGK